MKSKKDKIIDAAIDLFADKGFRNTSTAEIAATSGVAQGTLFYHFKNKEGILNEVLRQVLEACLEGYKTIDKRGNSGLACIETLLRREMTIVEQHNKKVSVLIRDMNDDCHSPGTPGHALINTFLSFKINTLCEFIRQGIADGTVRQVPVEETAWFIDAAFYGVMHIKLLKHLPVPPLDENAIQLLLAALTTNK